MADNLDQLRCAYQSYVQKKRVQIFRVMTECHHISGVFSLGEAWELGENRDL